MPKEQIKPRWEGWENICIQRAFEEKIQHKVIAIALGRTIISVSKRIKKLGLRKPTNVRGRLKGNMRPVSWNEKIPQDFAKMKEILQTYAPLEITQKGEWFLQDGYWTAAKALSSPLKKEELNASLRQENALYSLSYPLEYILSKDSFPEKLSKEKSFGNPFYVSLSHVEHWAASEGFHYVKESLREQGVLYWKDGKHFSKAQLLIYINRIRLEKKLQPLAVYEEESEC